MASDAVRAATGAGASLGTAQGRSSAVLPIARARRNGSRRRQPLRIDYLHPVVVSLEELQRKPGAETYKVDGLEGNKPVGGQSDAPRLCFRQHTHRVQLALRVGKKDCGG